MKLEICSINLMLCLLASPMHSLPLLGQSRNAIEGHLGSNYKSVLDGPHGHSAASNLINSDQAPSKEFASEKYEGGLTRMFREYRKNGEQHPNLLKHEEKSERGIMSPVGDEDSNGVFRTDPAKKFEGGLARLFREYSKNGKQRPDQMMTRKTSEHGELSPPAKHESFDERDIYEGWWHNSDNEVSDSEDAMK